MQARRRIDAREVVRIGAGDSQTHGDDRAEGEAAVGVPAQRHQELAVLPHLVRGVRMPHGLRPSDEGHRLLALEHANDWARGRRWSVPNHQDSTRRDGTDEAMPRAVLRFHDTLQSGVRIEELRLFPIVLARISKMAKDDKLLIVLLGVVVVAAVISCCCCCSCCCCRCFVAAAAVVVVVVAVRGSCTRTHHSDIYTSG